MDNNKSSDNINVGNSAQMPLLHPPLNSADDNLSWRNSVGMNSYTTHMKDPVVQNTQNPNITTTSFFGQQPNFRTILSSHNGQDDRHHFDPCFSNYNETDEKVVVQHNCREDHSMVPNDKRQEICTKGGVKIPFPVKLFNMLEHIDLQEPHLSSIISWQPNGRCFLTHDTKKLEELVLPKFFKQKQYASFRRQLNLWGFKRLTQNGPDNGAYYHELFLRSKTFLCRGITRTAPGGRRGVSSTRAPSNPEAEPKFYSMVSLPPSTILASALASDINANTMGGVTQDATLASSTTMLANGTIEGLVSDYSSSPCLELVPHSSSCCLDQFYMTLRLTTANDLFSRNNIFQPKRSESFLPATPNFRFMSDVLASNVQTNSRASMLHEMLWRNDYTGTTYPQLSNEIRRNTRSSKDVQSTMSLQQQSQCIPTRSQPGHGHEAPLD